MFIDQFSSLIHFWKSQYLYLTKLIQFFYILKSMLFCISNFRFEVRKQFLKKFWFCWIFVISLLIFPSNWDLFSAFQLFWYIFCLIMPKEISYWADLRCTSGIFMLQTKKNMAYRWSSLVMSMLTVKNWKIVVISWIFQKCNIYLL